MMTKIEFPKLVFEKISKQRTNFKPIIGFKAVYIFACVMFLHLSTLGHVAYHILVVHSSEINAHKMKPLYP
jgi:hypothetical protein